MHTGQGWAGAGGDAGYSMPRLRVGHSCAVIHHQIARLEHRGPLLRLGGLSLGLLRLDRLGLLRLSWLRLGLVSLLGLLSLLELLGLDRLGLGLLRLLDLLELLGLN
jgi:hypothetical protein